MIQSNSTLFPWAVTQFTGRNPPRSFTGGLRISADHAAGGQAAAGGEPKAKGRPEAALLTDQPDIQAVAIL